MSILPLVRGLPAWQARCVSTQSTQAVRDEKTTGPARRAGLVAWASLLIVYVVWGSTYLGIRVGVETMPPLLMAAARSLVAGLGDGSSGTSVAGVIIILAAAPSWALGIIMARRATIPSSPALASAMQLLAGGAALLLIATASGEFSSLRLGEVSARSWLA